MMDLKPRPETIYSCATCGWNTDDIHAECPRCNNLLESIRADIRLALEPYVGMKLTEEVRQRIKECMECKMKEMTDVKSGLDEPAMSEEVWLMTYFAYGHLPPKLQEVSSRFANLVGELLPMLPEHPERTVMLRKLLEAKDCAVRARMSGEL